ncbi:MAG: hypothetical protein Q8R63_10320 [Ramlibacter sp.]|nr:hypothetical protein [Ramlibacter sp.]
MALRRWWHNLPEPLKAAVYRRPIAEVRKIQSLGWSGYFFLEKWAAQMERAACDLPRCQLTGPPVKLWYLTGNRFWYQTAFCAWSFAKVADRQLSLHLIDDGTLLDKQVEQLRRLFSDVTVVSTQETEDACNETLPEKRFPVLRRLRRVYPHIRKLTDIHAGASGPKMVLDSDMLFYRKPHLLLDWLEDRTNAQQPIYMTDVVESYGYPRQALETLAGAPLPALVNVGICGLRSELLNWDELEDWCRSLQTTFGNSYFLEQALVAMLAARNPGTQVPAEEYVVMPTSMDVTERKGTLHHFVAGSKAHYFHSGWRRVLKAHDMKDELN